jgi:N-acetylglucosamine-6-phosphate deacetylase
VALRAAEYTQLGEEKIRMKAWKIPVAGEALVRGRWRGDGALLDVRVQAGRVVSVSPAGNVQPDLGGESAVLFPPLFDIQVNGAAGVDLQDPALDAEGLWRITEFLRGRGVGQWLPTIITNDPDTMEACCRAIVEALAEDKALARAIPGIHLEGPFISPEDGPRGAHPLEHVRAPEWRLMKRLLWAGEGFVRYVTLAPELPGAVSLIRRTVAAGVRVSLGHHAANAAQVRAAVEAGATLCTHLGNGVATQMQRHHNPLWPQLDAQGLVASLIADGHHLPPEVLRVIVRAKGPKSIVLVSDCTHLTGLRPGIYQSFGQAVELGRDGAIRIPGTQLLAGSASTLDACLARAVAAQALTWPQAIESATRIPAKLLGLRSGNFTLRPGVRANFSILAD